MHFKNRRRWSIVFIFSLTLLLFNYSCMQFRMNASEVSTHFKTKRLEAKQLSLHVGKRKINYVQVGDESLPLVVFVHGSPGSLSAFIHFLSDTTLLKRAQLIAVDRPGFGSSNFGVAEPSLEQQAALLRPILEKHNTGKKAILVGHSLGGPVIARMAMDFQELIGGLVMVAPSIDPDLEPNEWFRGPLALPFVKWMLPRSIRASNDEIWNLKPELEAMTPLWKHVIVPTIVIQGGEDKLVPKGNADYAEKMLVNADLEIILKADMNHFVPWNNPALIKEAIFKLLPL